MSGTTLGKITSEPNEQGKYTLKCPQCSTTFLSTITTNDTDGVIIDTVCPSCAHSDQPMLFVAVAHKDEVNNFTMAYVTEELNKSLGNLLR